MSKKYILLCFFICALISIPFFSLSSGACRGEEGLILVLPMIGGLPWNLIYFLLGFDIPGFTGPTDLNRPCGDTTIVTYLMVPVYINVFFIYFMFVLAEKRRRRLQEKEKVQSSLQ